MTGGPDCQPPHAEGNSRDTTAYTLSSRPRGIRGRSMFRICIAAVSALSTLGMAADLARGGPLESALAARFARLTRATAWTRVEDIPIAFPTFHPQGMVRIG